MNAAVIRRQGVDGGMKILLEAIGRVESPVTEAVDEDWGRVESEIIIEERYATGLTGLDGFSHALLEDYSDKLDEEGTQARRPSLGRSRIGEGSDLLLHSEAGGRVTWIGK